MGAGHESCDEQEVKNRDNGKVKEDLDFTASVMNLDFSQKKGTSRLN